MLFLEIYVYFHSLINLVWLLYKKSSSPSKLNHLPRAPLQDYLSRVFFFSFQLIEYVRKKKVASSTDLLCFPPVFVFVTVKQNIFFSLKWA